ncbi:MAG: hypothetical protein RIQ54_28 [Candidatus Parcubacteria bacterium]|jgi:uncharacterized protein (DUF305 family)
MKYKTIAFFFGIISGLIVGVGSTSLYYQSQRQSVDIVATPLSHENSLHVQMDAMTQGLVGKQGDEFDRAFLTEMIVHHEGAVTMARRALEQGHREQVQSLARTIITSQSAEIQQMEKWLTDWYGAQ